MDKYTIEYNNQSIVTKNWVPVTEDELITYKNEYYTKPSLEIV